MLDRVQAGRRLSVVVLAAVVLTGCRPEKAQPSGSEFGSAVAVATAVVQPVTFYEKVVGVGSVRAAVAVVIRPEIAGVLEGMHFVEGSTIEQGKLLFTLSQEKLQRQIAERRAALAAANAALVNAQRAFARADELTRRRVLSQAEWDQAQAALHTAEAEVRRLQAEVQLSEERFSDTQIYAPMAGVLSERRVNVGDVVQPGEALVTLQQTHPMEVALRVPSRFAGRVALGQQAEAVIDAYPDRRFAGQVTFVSPEISEQTRDFLVKITIDNREGLLKAGGFATAEVTTGVLENRPAVPEAALVATREGYDVFVVAGDKAELRRVAVGQRQHGLAEIREGVAVGESVVYQGQMRLTDGTLVRVVDPKAAPGKEQATVSRE
jgi:membrane fusion protein (multidrug efflux system)